MSKGRKWPTKGQALILVVIALLWLVNNAYAVMVEGRSPTGFYWGIQALNVAVVLVGLWLYRRAVKRTPSDTR